jgi:hypothetical protein
MALGNARAVIRVEQDTMLPATPLFPSQRMADPMRFPGDTFHARLGTPMPGARVRLLRIDSITRAELATQGVSAAEPAAFVRVYRHDPGCGPMRWISSEKFVIPGEVGYIRAWLAPRGDWVGDTPLFIVSPGYPYPGRATSAAGLASSFDVYGFEDATDLNIRAAVPENNTPLDLRRRAMAWAKANPQPAELDPIRRDIREYVLRPDWAEAERVPNRLRGTYRVDIEASGKRATWYFRTHDRPSFPWRGPDSLRYTTARLLTSAHIDGHHLVGYGASSRDFLVTEAITSGDQPPLVWLATSDRPAAPGNAARRLLAGAFEFVLAAVPVESRDLVQPLVTWPSRRDSDLFGRPYGQMAPKDRLQALVPITVRLDSRGGVRADTSIVVGNQRFRLSLQRLDTVSVRRPW